MAHTSMYDLQAHLRGDISDLDQRVHHHRYQADQLEHLRAQRGKQLQALTKQIERANAYEAEQRAAAAENQEG